MNESPNHKHSAKAKIINSMQSCEKKLSQDFIQSCEKLSAPLYEGQQQPGAGDQVHSIS